MTDPIYNELLRLERSGKGRADMTVTAIPVLENFSQNKKASFDLAEKTKKEEI